GVPELSPGVPMPGVPIPGTPAVPSMIPGLPGPVAASPSTATGLTMRPASVASPDEFSSYSHHDMVVKVDGIQPGQVGVAHQTWRGAAHALADGFDTFGAKVGRAIAEDWQGRSGQAAAQAISNYLQSALQAVEAAEQIANRLTGLVSALHNVQENMPQVPVQT